MKFFLTTVFFLMIFLSANAKDCNFFIERQRLFDNIFLNFSSSPLGSQPESANTTFSFVYDNSTYEFQFEGPSYVYILKDGHYIYNHAPVYKKHGDVYISLMPEKDIWTYYCSFFNKPSHEPKPLNSYMNWKNSHQTILSL